MKQQEQEKTVLPNDSVGLFQRDGEIRTTENKDNERTMTVSFASEEPYERWFGPEVLQVDETALDVSRFNNGLGCVLYNHNRDAVIGKINRVWMENGRAYADITFDEDEESEKVY